MSGLDLDLDFDLDERVLLDDEGLPSSATLRALTATRGVEHATDVLYQAIVRSPRYRPFIDAVQAQPAAPAALDGGVRVLVLPAFFYEQFPDSGGGGELVLEVGAACGVSVDVVRTRSVGSVSENAALVAERLRAEEGRRVWVVSLSKGGAELRRCLEEHLSEDENAKIEGWINVCGLVHGCHFVDVLLGSLSRRMATRLLAGAFGMDYDGLAELKTDDPRWGRPVELPSGLRVVNVLAVPHLEQVQKVLRGRYRRLAPLGPNDGMVLLREALLPGEILPIPGGDHFLRPAMARAVLYRLFRELFS